MPKEPIFFNEGLAYDSRSALQSPGYLQTAENIIFRKEGQQELRPKYSKYNTTALSAQHSIYRMGARLYVAGGTQLSGRISTTAGDFTALKTSFGTAKLWFDRYKGFVHMVNQTESYLADEATELNVYPADVANPAIGTMALTDSGNAGSPDGIYKGYMSWLITWPNGMTYETGLTAGSADVTVDTNQISWANIPVCSYAKIYGTNPTITKKLYRGPGTLGTLGDIYYVATIANATTTYADNIADTSLTTASYNDDYLRFDSVSGSTNPKYIKYHYGRLFTIATANVHRLYYSIPAGGSTSGENETIMPLAHELNNWDDLRTAGFDKVAPQGLITLGSFLYIPLKHTWIRKEGNTPSTWSYRKTQAMYGVGAPWSMKHVGRLNGIVSLSEAKGDSPTLTLFNGWTSEDIINGRYGDLFEDDLNADQLNNCVGEYDGRNYHLLYPHAANTTPTKHAVFDLSQYPKIRLAYWEDINSTCMHADSQSKYIYIGGSDGWVRWNSGAETITITVRTHELVGGKPELVNAKKTLKQLKWNADTGTAEALTLTIYLDGTAVTWADDTTSQALIGTGDDVNVLKMPHGSDCYRYSIHLTGAVTDLDLYSPWEMEFEFTE